MAPKDEQPKSDAPEGGWGWFVALAFALNNMVVIPTVQLFNLIYKDVFFNLEMGAVEINTIVAYNCACGMLLAIFNGPILRRFGFRKIAVFGIALIFIGNLLTSQSTSFWEFILFFSILVSIGMNLAMAAFHLALNTYFVVKRGVATGIAMSITGIGPVIMPFVVSFLMPQYGARGCGIIFSGIALHSLIGACMLHPVKWHRRKAKPVTLEEIELNSKKPNITINCAKDNGQSNEQKSEIEEEATPSTKLMENPEADVSKSGPRRRPKSTGDEELWKLSPLASELTPSSLLLADAVQDHVKSKSAFELNLNNEKETTLSDKENENHLTTSAQNDDQKLELENEVTSPSKLKNNVASASTHNTKEKSKLKDDDHSAPLKSLDDIVRPHEDTFFERIVKFFDFDLLGDPIYVNISLGLSVAFVSEMNFTLMLPIILEERSFDDHNIALCLSVMAGADIVSRFISPFFGQSIKSKVRIVYLVSLMSGILCRICFIYTSSHFSTIVVIFAMGVTKGIRTVYTALVIPTYVPLPKLASATGLQMVNNGLLFSIFGPFMGFVRKISKDYNNWIHVINCFTACTIIMWFAELYMLRARKKRKKPPIVIKNEQ